MEKRWNLLPTNSENVEKLQRILGISHTSICKILVQRGIDSFNKSRDYFVPNINQLHSPWLLKDMQKAVQRVLTAIAKNEKILVYGDYDVDGTTSVACMFSFLKKHHQNVDFYIPHRYKEGYGISQLGIEHAITNGFSLIISLDCGIKAVSLITYAQQKAIDFIVCDHHLPDATLPPALAILNARQPDCPYPYKELCGCGVGLKLIQAISEKMELPTESWTNYLDLVATAIAADIVPISGENRTLTYLGLQKVNTNPSTGIKALLHLTKPLKKVHVTDLVFVVAPRINAAGRMDDARKAVELFIEENFEKALELGEQLQKNNTDRKEADNTTTDQALTMLESDELEKTKKTTVLFKPDWSKGVVGIVASRLIEKYYKPTIVLTGNNGKISGSARSIRGFNVYEAIHQCKELLENYGGHFYAAGLTMKTENLEAFIQMFENVVTASITDDLLIPEIEIDAEISFKEITQKLYEIICRMEPFGPENMRPLFIAKNVHENGGSRIVKENHIKFDLKQGAYSFGGIGFGLAEKFPILHPNTPLDIVFSIDENEWNNEKNLQLRIIDLKKSVP